MLSDLSRNWESAGMEIYFDCEEPGETSLPLPRSDETGSPEKQPDHRDQTSHLNILSGNYFR